MSVWSVFQNFDEVLVPADHVSRNPNDTYYIDTETVLRCHTSAHQAETLRKGERAFLVTGVLIEPSMRVRENCTFP
jgi:phenylalanyl-tRNA synthetase alpha chain